MEEQFVLRVTPALAERLNRVLDENPEAGDDDVIDLSFQEDGRTGKFVIGGDSFPASLLDLPCVVESWKTYDDSNLVKTADIGQIIVVREDPVDTAGPPQDDLVYPDGLTPPMRDPRRRRFRRESEINPEVVAEVEKDLLSIMAGGTAKGVDIPPSPTTFFSPCHPPSPLPTLHLLLPPPYFPASLYIPYHPLAPLPPSPSPTTLFCS